MTQIYITSEEEIESPDSKSLDQLITFSTEKDVSGRQKPTIITPQATVVSTPKVMKTVSITSAKPRHRNRVDVVTADFRKASEEDLRSAKGVRRLRKKVRRIHSLFFFMGHSRPLFFIFVFSMQLKINKQMCYVIICR